jgi:hypothetical protein
MIVAPIGHLRISWIPAIRLDRRAVIFASAIERFNPAEWNEHTHTYLARCMISSDFRSESIGILEGLGQLPDTAWRTGSTPIRRIRYRGRDGGSATAFLFTTLLPHFAEKPRKTAKNGGMT